jgi:hypothetical protein
VSLITIGYVYINSVAINDIYDFEGLGMVPLKIVRSYLPIGSVPTLAVVADRGVVKRDKNSRRQQAQNH